MRILVLGATGAAGGSLLDAALASPLVTEARTLSRRKIETGSARHVGFVHADLLDYRPVAEAFAGVDAAFYCIGRSVSQVGDEPAYRRLAFEAAEVAARQLAAASPAAAFHYLSGQGASLASRQMWARVKAEAERSLLARHAAVCWRPGAIDARRTEGWPFFYPAVIRTMRWIFPSRRYYVRGEDLGRAMLEVAAGNARSRILENPEIRTIADHVRARSLVAPLR
jgi:hypothetical protein